MFRVTLLLLATADAIASINKTVRIAPGVDMPLLNFGACESGCHKAFIELGGRGLDTAFIYGDDQQHDVGQSVLKSGLSRSEFFVTSKVPCCPQSNFNGGIPVSQCGNSTAADLQHDLDVLGLEYVDLMLMHWPCDSEEDTLATYRQMEKFLAAGKARTIGVSNFNAAMLDTLVAKVSTKPSVNQVGFSIGNHAISPDTLPSKKWPSSYWGSNDATQAKCKELGITLMAYAPLGGTTGINVMHDPRVGAVAASHGRNAAQIALRWLVQQGIACVTSSNNTDHIKSDFQIFDFELTAEEMERLRAIQPPAYVTV